MYFQKILTKILNSVDNFCEMKKIALFTSTLIGSGLAYDYLSDSYVFTRNLRTVRCGINILYSYKIAFNE